MLTHICCCIYFFFVSLFRDLVFHVVVVVVACRERERERREIEAKEQQQRERERERERERIEKQRAAADQEREKQAHYQVEQHFQESLLRYQQQLEQKGVPSSSWSLPPSGGSNKGQPSNQQPPSSQPTLLMPASNSAASSSQEQRDKDKDNRERYMAAYNLALDRDRELRERNSASSGARQSAGHPLHPPNSSSSSTSSSSSSSASGSGNNPYTALPRADLSFSIQGYQTAPIPSSNALPSQQQQQQQRKTEPLSNSHHHLASSSVPADYSSKSGSVIVGPGDAAMRELQRIPDPRDQPQQRPPLSYKPYEPSPRPSGNSRTSRSPLQQQPMIPPTSTASSYPLHYAGPGPGPGGSSSSSSSHPHSFSPSPMGSGSSGGSGGNGGSNNGNSSSSRSGPPTNYMPPPSVSPSRSPAATSAVHPSYPAMRYSPAPQTAPVPSTSPSAAGPKKTSPSPMQQQQHQQHLQASSSAGTYGRPLIAGGATIGRPDQTVPLSLITPSKSSVPVYTPVNESSAPPPAHTARSSDPQRELRDIRERDIRLYPHTAFSPLSHPLPPPQSLPTNSRSLVPPVGPQLQLPQQQQPLDLGTYREDSPIPLISSARLSTGETLNKKGRPDGPQPGPPPPPTQQQPPPPPIPAMPAYPSLGPVVAYPGAAPLMSVAALIDAGINTSAAQVKPPPSSSGLSQLPPGAAAAYALGLTTSTNRHPSDTPPLMPGGPAVTPLPVIIKSEPPASDARSPSVTHPESAMAFNRSTRSPLPPDVKVKQEPQPVTPSQPQVVNCVPITNTTTKPNITNITNTTSTSNPTNVAPSGGSSGSSSARPVHKLKTAWLQRHTGQSILLHFSSSSFTLNWKISDGI